MQQHDLRSQLRSYNDGAKGGHQGHIKYFKKINPRHWSYGNKATS